MKVLVSVVLSLDMWDMDKFDEFNTYVDDCGYSWDFKPDPNRKDILTGVVTAGNLTPAEAENFIQYCLRFHKTQEPA